jgi:hypothetical protein
MPPMTETAARRMNNVGRSPDLRSTIQVAALNASNHSGKSLSPCLPL